MSERNAWLSSIQPELEQLQRLFYGFRDAPEEKINTAVPLYRYETWTVNNLLYCRAAYGAYSVLRSAEMPADDDRSLRALHGKRTARRLVKNTVYELLRGLTGIRPPWGSSTGVRPTHLLIEAMDQGMDLAQAEQAVIERFDISPEKAALLRETVQTQLTLRPPSLSETNIYIGIPFCPTRCSYCSFSSGEIGDGRLVGPYLEALSEEIRLGAGYLRESGLKLRAVYIGGGTPTSLDEDSFARLLDLVMQYFPGSFEYTVEAGRPDTITAGKLRRIRASGVNRISINPQSMADKTLKTIGRAHTAAQTEAAYALAREAGVSHINMDVIAALPGEDLNDFQLTMDAAMRLRPESLTVHTLALKRTSALWLGGAALPDGRTAAEMVRLGRATAKAMGMEPYYLYRQKAMAGGQENVGYALPGHACQYNVDMMEETTHVWAFGACGISKRIYPDEGHIGRAPNVSNIEQYIARRREMAERKRRLFE